VNLGKNKTSEDAAAAYVQGVHTLSQYADYLVGNNFTCAFAQLLFICNWDHEHWFYSRARYAMDIPSGWMDWRKDIK
jgi:hypothetical protein